MISRRLRYKALLRLAGYRCEDRFPSLVLRLGGGDKNGRFDEFRGFFNEGLTLAKATKVLTWGKRQGGVHEVGLLACEHKR